MKRRPHTPSLGQIRLAFFLDQPHPLQFPQNQVPPSAPCVQPGPHPHGSWRQNPLSGILNGALRLREVSAPMSLRSVLSRSRITSTSRKQCPS
jgi:hypothetical protein